MLVVDDAGDVDLPLDAADVDRRQRPDGSSIVYDAAGYAEAHDAHPFA